MFPTFLLRMSEIDLAILNVVDCIIVPSRGACLKTRGLLYAHISRVRNDLARTGWQSSQVIFDLNCLNKTENIIRDCRHSVISRLKFENVCRQISECCMLFVNAAFSAYYRTSDVVSTDQTQ